MTKRIEVDTGIRLYACYDTQGVRRSEYFKTRDDALARRQRGWHVDELVLKGKRKAQSAQDEITPKETRP